MMLSLDVLSQLEGLTVTNGRWPGQHGADRGVALIAAWL
jgi:hypothetical protein